MCLAIPGRVVSIDESQDRSVPALVIFGQGEPKQVDLVMLPEVSVGDYVVVHSGFAISRLSADEATETIGLFNSVPADAQPTD